MICIVLVAGHGTLLEQEIKLTEGLDHLHGVPKSLLPAPGGDKILDFWWKAINTRQLFSNVYLVTNADKYKHYERWASANDFPLDNIINDGTSTYENRLGAIADLDLVLRSKQVSDEVLVVAGDMLFQDAKFDMSQVVSYFRSKPDGDLAIYYDMEQDEITESRGIVEVSPSDNIITKFFEKPSKGMTESRHASVVFYCFRHQTLQKMQNYMSIDPDVDRFSFGRFMEWLINEEKEIVYGMKLPTGFQLIGQVGVDDYKRWLEFFTNKAIKDRKSIKITKRAYARVGLIGNPSDGFHGKTIAMSIKNFWAEVNISESPSLVLTPHALNDPTEFGSLEDLYGTSRKEGYLGGLRLLQATCKKFYQYCSKCGIALAKRNFTLSYDTNIPRQVGLAGSSAIVTATLKCLMQFFNLSDMDIPKALQPQFILDVEKDELFIQAGLQDRVVQIYENIVFMDFSKEHLDKFSHGVYEYLGKDINQNDLPDFWLAYLGDPSDSGKIHSDVSIRWKAGDKDIVEGMKKFADLTDKARIAFQMKNWTEFASIMDQNFDLRRSLYGDAALGAMNLKMIEIGRKHGSAAKFPGSGGAVVGLCLDPSNMELLKQDLQKEGCVFCLLRPNL